MKDPTGGVMVAVAGGDQQSGDRVQAQRPRPMRRDSFVVQQPAAEPLPPQVGAQGFETLERDVDVRSAVPIDVDLTLALAAATE